MEGYEDIEKMVADRLAVAGVDVCTAIATRAVFRTLPLLMLYSETLRNTPTPVEPFGFWPEEHRKTYLLALMQTYSIVAFLAQRELPVRPLALSSYESCLPIADVFFSSLASVETASDAEHAYFTQGSKAHKGLVLSLRSVRKIFKSLPPLLRPLYNELYGVRREAEATEQVIYLTGHLAKLYSEAASTARQLSAAENFSAASIQAAKDHSDYLVKRFTLFSETTATVAVDLDQPPPLTTFVSAARVAAEAFAAVSRELELGNIDAFATALSAAMASMDVYEVARIGTIPFNDHISFDLFSTPDAEKFAAVQITCGEDFARGMKQVFIHFATCAEYAIEACKAAAADSANYDSARAAFESFASACDAIDPRAFSTDSFNVIVNQSGNLIADFIEHEASFYSIRSLDDASFNEYIHDAASKVIAATISAYCAHDFPDLYDSFKQSLVADLNFISEFSCRELESRPIWITPASADNLTEFERRLPSGIAIWQELWGSFQRDALAIAPDAQPWLDWCHEFFAGNPGSKQRLQQLLNCPCTAPTFPQVASKEDVSTALIL